MSYHLIVSAAAAAAVLYVCDRMNGVPILSPLQIIVRQLTPATPALVRAVAHTHQAAHAIYQTLCAQERLWRDLTRKHVNGVEIEHVTPL